ncbi:MAG: HEAT repeat domain-containing protein [Steroidobacteraceae bacterium]
MLQLVQDKDEDIRRAAIEILNQTKDERAVDHLIQATRDNDWWVSERAIDALAEIGSKRAMPRLLEMLKAGNAKALPVVVRALGKLGEPQHIDAILPMLERPEREIRIEAIQALAKLADDRQAAQVRAGLQSQLNSTDQTVAPAGHCGAGGNGCAHGQQSDHHAWNPDVSGRPGGAGLDDPCAQATARRHHALRAPR